MKKFIILFVFILASFVTSKGICAQGKSLRQKRDISVARQQREKNRYQRMQLQLQQVAYHEAREKRAEKAIRDAERAEKTEQ